MFIIRYILVRNSHYNGSLIISDRHYSDIYKFKHLIQFKVEMERLSKILADCLLFYFLILFNDINENAFRRGKSNAFTVLNIGFSINDELLEKTIFTNLFLGSGLV